MTCIRRTDLQLSPASAGLPPSLYHTRIRRTAIADYLTRRFTEAVAAAGWRSAAVRPCPSCTSIGDPHANGHVGAIRCQIVTSRGMLGTVRGRTADTPCKLQLLSIYAPG